MEENLERWIDQFLHHVVVEKGLSPNTLEAYARDLRGYGLLLRGKGILEVEKISPEEPLHYLKIFAPGGFPPEARPGSFPP
jgi:integrase/recombinase XerD